MSSEAPFGLLFNVGSRRSGTYWLQRIVGSHPAVGMVPSETHLFADGFAPLLDRFQDEDPEDLTVGKVFLERDRQIHHLRELSLEVFSRWSAGNQVVAERTAPHVRHLSLISEIHPDARFIHIIRDGRDVARSILNQRWGPTTIAGAATEWRDSVLAGRNAGIGPDRYREVRYEDLLGDPGGVASGLFAWLGLESGGEVRALAEAEAARQLNVGPSQLGEVGTAEKWRERWGHPELAEFDSVAGELLRELGYAESDGIDGERETGHMASFWDERARENAMYFVNNSLDYDDTDPDQFWRSGERDLDAMLGAVDARIEPGERVLELGCGIGRMTRAVASRAEAVVAVDVSPAMLERARSENPGLESVEWTQGDGNSLQPVPSDSLDGVLSWVVLQHIPDPEVSYGYVEEMGRVLRPGGWAVFGASNDHSVHGGSAAREPKRRGGLLRRARRGEPGGQDQPEWLGSAIDLDVLAERAARAGMAVERVEGAGSQFCVIKLRRG